MSDSAGEWQFYKILYADNTALLADENCKLHSLVSEFRRMWEKRKLSVIVAKSKVMRVTRREDVDHLGITLNGRS
jgi:hypothetical protein